MKPWVFLITAVVIIVAGFIAWGFWGPWDSEAQEGAKRYEGELTDFNVGAGFGNTIVVVEFELNDMIIVVAKTNNESWQALTETQLVLGWDYRIEVRDGFLENFEQI